MGKIGKDRIEKFLMKATCLGKQTAENRDFYWFLSLLLLT